GASSILLGGLTSRRSLQHRLVLLHRPGRQLRLGPDDIDTSLKISSVVDADTRGAGIADQAALVANGDFLESVHITLDPPIDNDLAGFDVGFYFSMGPHSNQAL